MGSPVSLVVAEIVMQIIEQQALASYKRTIPLWLRYVDDTFTALHNDIYDRSSYSIYWRYTNHLTLKMTSAQVVSV